MSLFSNDEILEQKHIQRKKKKKKIKGKKK